MNFRLAWETLKRNVRVSISDYSLLFTHLGRELVQEVKSIPKGIIHFLRKPNFLVIVSVIIFAYASLRRDMFSFKLAFVILVLSVIWREKMRGDYKGEYRKEYFSQQKKE